MWASPFEGDVTDLMKLLVGTGNGCDAEQQARVNGNDGTERTAIAAAKGDTEARKTM